MAIVLSIHGPEILYARDNVRYRGTEGDAIALGQGLLV